jgi:hypothetical protein
MFARVVSVLALVCALAGCSNGPEAPNPTEDLPVGSHGELTVDAHCGFEFATIDGEVWKTKLVSDGQGNPPLDWPQMVEGTIERTSNDEAVFNGSNVDYRAVVTPAPDAKYTCM